jgi:NAD(P)-dependent dehydrogenase (short-subunit alcohol dehydrogenase family)
VASVSKQAAIVTGGSRGIGAAIVHQLSSQFSVLTCGRGARPKDLDAGIGWVTGDVSRSEDCASIVSEARRLGPVTVLVNNAGVQLEKTITQSSDADWQAVIGTNCQGVFNMCREVLPEMEKDGGSIVNIGSISGHVADPSLALYNASKAFVHGLTRSIAVDHGPKVRCNAVCPGWIMTDMAASAFATADSPEAAQRDALRRHPAGRFGTPEDVAAMVTWLVSDAASFVTGQCFTVDGGLTSASPLQPRFF